jgi:hypothetical protein
LKIKPDSDAWINPLSIVPKWAIIAMELAGVDLGVVTAEGDKAIIETFRQAEESIIREDTLQTA